MVTVQAFALSAKLSAPTAEFFRDLDAADARFRKSEQTWRKITQDLDRDISRASGSLSRLGSDGGLSRLTSASGFGASLSNAFRQVGDAAESHGARTESAASRMLKSLASLGSGAGSALMGGAKLVGGAALAGAGIGVTAATAAMGVAVKQSADFEQTLNILQATGSFTAEQMAALREQALALGEDLSLPATSANDAALAMLEMTKAGREFGDLMSGTKGTLQLSAAAQVENARAAEISASALNAFNLAGKDTVRVADVMAATVNASAADFSDLADAYAMAGGVLAGANQSFEDMNIALGLLANRGIKGSDAGTSLKTAIMRLQAPTDVASKLMYQYGIAAYDAEGKMRPLRDLIDQFSTKLANLDDQTRDDVLGKIFGSDAIRAARFVFMAGPQGFDQLAEKVTKAGAAGDLAASRMKGLRGAWEGFTSNLETAGIRLGSTFQAPLEGLVRWAADQVPVVAAKLEEGGQRIQRAISVFTDPANAGLSAKTKWTSAAAVLGFPDDIAARVGDIATGIEGAYERLKKIWEAPTIQGKAFESGFKTSDAAVLERWAIGLKGLLDDAAKSMTTLATKWQDMHKEPTVKYDIDTTTALGKIETLRIALGLVRQDFERETKMGQLKTNPVDEALEKMKNHALRIWEALPPALRDWLNGGVWTWAENKVKTEPGMVVDVNTGLPRRAEGYGAGQVIDVDTGLPRAAVPAPGPPAWASGGYIPSTTNNTNNEVNVNVYGTDPRATAREVVNELRLQGVRP